MGVGFLQIILLIATAELTRRKAEPGGGIWLKNIAFLLADCRRSASCALRVESLLLNFSKLRFLTNKNINT